VKTITDGRIVLIVVGNEQFHWQCQPTLATMVTFNYGNNR
jgi:hypothetical protein